MESSSDSPEPSRQRPVSQTSAPRKAGVGRFLPLVVLALGFALFFAFGLEHQLSLATLKTHRQMLESWVGGHPFAAALAFIGAYALIVAFSVPVGALMTLAGGFLFGTWEGGGLVVVAATIGATIIFLATRTALAAPMRTRVGPRIAAMEDGFRKNAFNYLLVLRLVPLFPFFPEAGASGRGPAPLRVGDDDRHHSRHARLHRPRQRARHGVRFRRQPRSRTHLQAGDLPAADRTGAAVAVAGRMAGLAGRSCKRLRPISA
jgi:hypothetical protein